MPSLRRTMSSPSVRSSPYPSSLSAGSALRSQGNGPRRSSGSDTYSRRVLADIEWWRVAVGQHDVDTDQASDVADENHHHHFDHNLDRPAGTEANSSAAIVGAFPPMSDWISFMADSRQTSPVLPAMQLSVMSITPTTPDRHYHVLEGSSSSLESTPEAPESPVEGVRLRIDELDIASFPESTREREHSDLPLFLARSHSWAHADFSVSPLSSQSAICN